MQKYAEALEFLLDKKCAIKIFPPNLLKLNYLVHVDNGEREAHGIHKSWRRALCIAKQDFQNKGEN